jgi:small conductance mechanosensitive channel
MDWQPYAEQVWAWLAGNVPDLVAAVVIAAVTMRISSWAKGAVQRTAVRAGGDEILWTYLGSVARWVLIVIGLTTALKQAGVPVDALLTSFGISGVIIGLGARTSIANYFAGIMMLGARPFKQGDLIEFGPPPQIGRVTEVKMTYTGMVTLDNVQVIVPNSVMWRNKIVNFSREDMRAIRVPIGIPYDVDVDWVSDIALSVLARHAAVVNDPAPTFTLSDVTADRVKGLLVAWSRVETMNVFGDVVISMRKEFETAGLAVTVPAQDVDLKREE